MSLLEDLERSATDRIALLRLEAKQELERRGYLPPTSALWVINQGKPTTVVAEIRLAREKADQGRIKKGKPLQGPHVTKVG